MWGIIGILVIGVIISFLELPPLVKNKDRKEITVFFLLLLIGIGFNLLLSINVEIPNPTYTLIKIFSPVNDFVEKILS